MVKKLVVIMAAACVVALFVACSGDGKKEEDTRMYDAQRDALEQAREVESVLQEAEEKRRQEIKEMEDTH
ncbi:hypothetical protein [Desulfoluna butyratoxydans]|uniref:Secreted protein n=1 Tax=Desulfoluna butyratoxydans TaxID=231438 RepID=A0A4U8YUV2_9BACT|nr:hypothetical protein [Desulfoluna butyratoxydans]VFQ45143.1 hypothetical protein MSL71_28000 [Desulfoluna butyratoxydans]